jgi:hypothetical protein
MRRKGVCLLNPDDHVLVVGIVLFIDLGNQRRTLL